MSTNDAFKKYYKEQLNLNDEEWSKFLDILEIPLPVAFRFTGSRKHANELKDFMKNDLFPKLSNIVIDGKKIEPPFSVGWYPNELCWQFDVGRTLVRRSKELQEFHRFLVSETEVILDTCASPGSKTAQLLEGIDDESGFPDGLVIANDSEQTRCYTLVHQAKRIHSPCLLVTNHKAQEFPRLKKQNTDEYVQFDRILCDVPCSGDGTIRKNSTIFKRWNIASGNSIHKIQKQILHRSCELLKVGGRLVYSTCSLNPIENEAVVASMLKEANGALRLVDVSSELATLKRFPGLKHWKVANRHGVFSESFKESKETFLESMFPPEDIEKYDIQRCLRVYPQLQNTGGFFVAVLEKVGSFGSIDRRVAQIQDEQSENKKRRVDENNAVTSFSGHKESPFIFLSEEDQIIKECRDIYGISPNFASGLFVVRSAEKKTDYNWIYLVSEKVKEVLGNQQLKVINSGVKIFKKNFWGDSAYRICSEGVSTIGPQISAARQVLISFNDLLVFIKCGYPKFEQFSEDASAKLKNISAGSCMLKFQPKGDNAYKGSLTGDILLPFFRANVSCSLLLNKAERKSLLFRLSGETIDEIEGLSKDVEAEKD